jgi:hypothetical protein
MPSYAPQEMVSWKSTEMVRRYAHLTPTQKPKTRL